MKNKTFLLLLLLLAFKAGINAQVVDTRWDTIPSLVISEVRLYNQDRGFIELTNVGTNAFSLKGFKLALSSDYKAAVRGFKYLPDVQLQPGETYVVSTIHDLGDKNWDQNLGIGPNGKRQRTMPEYLQNVDLPVFRSEQSTPKAKDSISVSTLRDLVNVASYERNLILEYKKGNDSVFVDLVNATAPGGISTFIQWIGLDIYGQRNKMAIAGIPDVIGAYGQNWGPIYTIVRKTTVKHGNVDWDMSRGSDANNSEWIVVPDAANDRQNRWEFAKYFTTIGKHGNGTIDATTVKSDVVSIDFATHKMTVPWGVTRFKLMDYFTLGENLTWQLIKSTNSADSSYYGVRNGDKLAIYATGASVEKVVFELVLGASNVQTKATVMPRLTSSFDASRTVKSWNTAYEVTYGAQYKVAPTVDTILNVPFSARVDTLFKYLEKADGAAWEIVWVDGKVRADLKVGDILKVTNGGTSKDYFIKVNAPALSNNSYLKSIKWPDAPSAVRSMPGWNGFDVIPGFMNATNNYVVTVPITITDAPVLTAIPENLNASVTIVPVNNILGLASERTATITVTSENGLLTTVYTVRFDIDKPTSFVQPVAAEPLFTRFLSNIAVYDQYVEISNPGTTAINLSNYMIVSSDPGTSPADIIKPNDNFGNAVRWYIPGYVYAPEAEFNSKMMIVQPDYQVNPILSPGKSLTLSLRVNGDFYWDWMDPSRQNRSSMNLNPYTDITFTHINQFKAVQENRPFFLAVGKVYYRAGSDWNGPVAKGRENHIQSLYKIKNDSITRGLKAVGDPKDFELIDVFGTYDGTKWAPYNSYGVAIPGRSFWNWDYLARSTERKPEAWKPNPLPGNQGSWAATAEESEWIMRDEFELTDKGIVGYLAEWQIGLGLGTHIFAPVTDNSSTVLSKVYNVSKGYTSPQTAKGVITGTSVTDFLANIIKNNPGQTIAVINNGIKNTGNVISNDTLKVTSSDGKNITKYVLTVSDAGLSDNAVLVARAGSGLSIGVSGTGGTISGVKLGTTLELLLYQAIKPAKATLKVFDENGNRVPLQTTTADLSYMKVIANDKMVVEVTSENSLNKITYQLAFEQSSANSAFLFSNLYKVDQDLNLVSLISVGTTAQTLFKNLMTNEGATMKLLDKTGAERAVGNVALDDYVLVTSADGSFEKVYFLSFVEEKFGSDAYVTSKVLYVDQLGLSIAGIPLNTSVELFLSGLVTPAEGATLTLLNAAGDEVTTGMVELDYKLKVTSGNQEKIVTYTISVNLSIAFVTSNVLVVDEIGKTIAGVPFNTSLELFLGMVTPATGATLEVLNANNVVVVSGIIVGGYKVRVTSGDNTKIVTYTISVNDNVSVANSGIELVQVYPNPATDQICILGLRKGCNILVTNLLGKTVKMVDSNNILNATISVGDLPSGIYLIQVTAKNYKSIPVKLFKQ